METFKLKIIHMMGIINVHKRDENKRKGNPQIELNGGLKEKKRKIESIFFTPNNVNSTGPCLLGMECDIHVDNCRKTSFH